MKSSMESVEDHFCNEAHQGKVLEKNPFDRGLACLLRPKSNTDPFCTRGMTLDNIIWLILDTFVLSTEIRLLIYSLTFG